VVSCKQARGEHAVFRELVPETTMTEART
jgi:hypothetical protein